MSPVSDRGWVLAFSVENMLHVRADESLVRASSESFFVPLSQPLVLKLCSAACCPCSFFAMAVTSAVLSILITEPRYNNLSVDRMEDTIGVDTYSFGDYRLELGHLLVETSHMLPEYHR